MRLTSLLLRATTLVVVPAALSAQSTAPSARIFWLIYGGDHRVTSRTSLTFDFHGRGEALESGWRQYLIRPGIAVRVAGQERVLRASAGWATLRTTTAVDEPASPRIVEQRAWQMLQLGHAAGPTTFTHRVRLEQRWESTTPAGGASKSWRYANRLRYSTRVATPLSAISPRLHVAASDELFAGFGGIAGPPGLDQNRLTLALGAALRPTFRVELGYLNQSTRSADVLAVRRHALYLGLSSSEPIRR